ncbi:hypothetical protein BZA70DRAFT_271907 [Myxozyma melibiosi]|uniref:Cyclase n=1 Tax=Myxozyma melibiosi TaxID=54550 RepID=A0ABR1FEU7_9ASCO
MSLPYKSFSDLPDYDSLANKERFWVWGPPGSHEEGMGMMNLLTPKHVATVVAPEIRTGERCGLGWEFHKLENPPFGRVNYQMTVLPIAHGAFDDQYTFNPQQSSQWDGFRHHSQPTTHSHDPADAAKVAAGADDCLWYGGTTREEISTPMNRRIGMQHWAQDGIVARGILLDYASWAKEVKGISYSSFSMHEIKLSELKEVMEYYKVESKPGDMLFVRIGLIEEWNGYTQEQREAYQAADVPQHAGLEETEEVLRWLWNSHFVAVASDAVSWEVFPPQSEEFNQHHHLLAGWGVPIGEMFDLEALSALCKKLGRYSFFVSSVPSNAVGGVSSPPNAVAIF